MIDKMLYPLKFKPVKKKHNWGEELFLLSGLESDETEVREGFLSGNTPNELTEVYMGEMVGDNLYQKFGTEFPLLFKRIITKDRLPIQIHPTNELAAERHNAYGVDKLWYINFVKEGAKLYLGFKSGITLQDYISAVETNTIKDILNSVEVKSGDIYSLPAGVIHSADAGITITEIAQNSDITYKIYDWERVNKDGSSEELDIELAEEAIDFNAIQPRNLKREIEKNRLEMINANEHFVTELIDVNGEFNIDYSGNDSFVALVSVKGNADIEYDIDGVVGLDEGEVILIPADLEDVRIVGNVMVMKIEPSGV